VKPRPPFRLQYDLARARPLFIDAWPASWAARAPATTLVWLDASEVSALGRQIMGCQHWFADVPPEPLRALRHRLAEALAEQGAPAFVRLTSRSPKDSLRAMRHGLRVATAEEALALVMEASERAAHDLRACLDAGVPLAFAIRPWIDFEPWQEWRCVMRARRWAGASAPLGLSEAQADRAARFAEGHGQVLRAAVAELADAAGVDDAVFDLLVPATWGSDSPCAWTLLDANPLLPQTGLGWFESVACLDEALHWGPWECHTASAERASSKAQGGPDC